MRIASSYHAKDGILIAGIASIIPHEWYDDDTYDYDVALIKVRVQPSFLFLSLPLSRARYSLILWKDSFQLSAPISLGRNARIVPLATASTPSPKAGSRAMVAGWGKTSVRALLSLSLFLSFGFRGVSAHVHVRIADTLSALLPLTFHEID